MVRSRHKGKMIAAMLLAALCTSASFAAADQAANGKAGAGLKTGNPEDHLPANITRLSWFGERASWSPDGRKVAFMSKSFGDAFEIDVRTGELRVLTPYPHAGYLRAQYLPNGDLFLIGARKFENPIKTRFEDQEMWVLRKDGKSKPIPLDHKIFEGIAISRQSMKIAWANSARNYPGQIAPNVSIVYVADIVEENGVPKLANKREVLRSNSADCGLEVQDFRNNDQELIYSCYRLPYADVMGVDLKSGKVTTYRKIPQEYNEAEGIFPDGRHILVESSRGKEKHSDKYIDVWKLRLEPDGTDMVRLTHWGDYDGYKASNPVVSPDGKMIVFQSGRRDDLPGVGYGLFLLRLQ
ncbi:PD40 domain-containing protein [Sphingobium sp. DC-2]|uniref:TolB family protein n=1 Tax=Sphingobium sp. DC-2 TaxID=1303256 RepID=UPI00068D24C1|nr:PD40 domain-containing protein [Sphingobium sp. DC-2]